MAFAADFNCNHRSFVERAQDLYQTVAIIDEEDRRDESSYAREKGLDPDLVKKRFAPTGMILCGGKPVGTAQVSYKNNVLTTAAHIFHNYDTCKVENKVKDCIFRTEADGKAFVSEIKDQVANGLTAKCPNQKRYDDWAVLRLSTPLPESVQAYKLADGDVRENEDVIQVSASANDFYTFNPRTGRREYPKTLGDCKTKKVYSWGSGPIYFSSNCDTGSGASGGAAIRMQADRPTLMGIFVGNHESDQQEALATRGKRPNPNRGAYAEGQWASYHIPVTGDFRAAIKRAGDSEDI